MADGLVPALIKFGETLSDGSVEPSQKLRVLNTLNDVKLTLSELSESGLGRIVSRLKNEPGDLGTTARILVTKWKNLLQNYLKRESAQLSDQPGSVGEGSSGSPVHNPTSLTNGHEHSHTPDRQNLEVSHVQKSSTLVRRSTKIVPTPRPSDTKSQSSSASAPLASTSYSSVHSSVTKSTVPSASTSSSLSSSANRSETTDPVQSANETSKSKRKRKPSADTTDSIDASSGLSFMESLCAVSTSQPVRKKRAKSNKTSRDSPCLPVPGSVPTPPRPSASFTAEVLSSLNEDVDRPDIVNRSLSTNRPGTLEDDDDDGDLKFKSKKILWVPKPSRNHHPARVGQSGSSGSTLGSPSLDQFQTPPSLIDLCLVVVERNLSRVDHVGQVPYELFGRALKHATPAELAHIEQCNP
ncbi:unnamed protein product, partial [Echinostoma caproni]|uniref:TFIIS N-terminal domain-containing protein n=1 Tax=Echinostoma caproni TaxID=27848 RepID=A0A183AVX6_9TREM